MDLYTRRIVGFSVLTNHSVQLVINALFSAVHSLPPPVLLHSDRGSEYTSHDMEHVCNSLGIQQSMSRTACPWENGYQESFYSQFKVDLGDPNRFELLGELVYEIYQTIYTYNHTRIHTALKMAPNQYALHYEITQLCNLEKVSDVWGT
jgi:putative transposase